MAETKPIDPRSFSTSQVLALWQNNSRRLQHSRRRVLLCRDIQKGLLGWTRPDLKPAPDGTDPIDDALTARLPQRLNYTLDTANRLSQNHPILVRAPIGSTPSARRGAELTALWDNTATDDALDKDEVFLKGTEDGEMGVVILPSTAHFRQSPDLMDILESDAYDALPEKERTDYEAASDSEDVTRYQRPKERYWRDAQGRAPGEKGYTTRSGKSTRKAYDEEHQAYLASIPPWSVRLISPTDCVPIFATGRGKKRLECRGLIIRTLYDRESLLEDEYVWDGMDNPALITTGYDPSNSTGANGQIYLYEAHTIIKGEWIVAYSVAGLDTKYRATKDGEQAADAVRNLTEEYGLRRPLFDYFYFLHTGADNPDQRGIPLLWPVAQMILGAESLLTATQVHAVNSSFNGYFAEIDPKAPREAYLESNGELRKFAMPQSGEVAMVPGKMIPAIPAEVGETARYVLERELALLGSEERTSQAAGVTSGHGLNVAEDIARAMNRQIPEGVRQVVEFVGTGLLELACAIKRKHGIAVPIQVNEEIEPGADNPDEPETKWRILELQDRWIGNVYKLTAVYPAKGNIAEQSLELDMWQKGASTLEKVLVKKGIEQPIAEAAKIHAEQILTGTPEGKLTMLADFLRWRGEQERAATIEAQLAQRLSQFGMPTAALVPGAPAAGQMMGAPNGQAGPGVESAPTVAGTQAPGGADQIRGGIVAGQTEAAAKMADALSQARAGGGI